ncbi:hypothetical protein LZC95_17345 [Pendulispora brunnea]|uniref:Lipoprotein n=1 Tax=Pendulispora brunnea TaxID=2905690 RepID=A0ABZ2KKJ2_9BACT
MARMFKVSYRRTILLGCFLVGQGLALGACGGSDSTGQVSTPETRDALLASACDRWVMDLAEHGLTLDRIIKAGANDGSDDNDFYDWGPKPPHVDLRTLTPAGREIVMNSYRTACIDYAALPSSQITGAWLDACREALVAELSAGSPPHTMPGSCKPPAGVGTVGSPCTGHHQCGSLRCDGTYMGHCGTCLPPATVGESCGGISCGIGFFCAAGPIPPGGHAPSRWTCEVSTSPRVPPDPVAPVVCGSSETGSCASDQLCGGPVSRCARLVAEGESCIEQYNDKLTCAPRSKCVDGRCRAMVPTCPR